MFKQKTAVYFVTAVLVAVILLCVTQTEHELQSPVSFQVFSEDGSRIIETWENEDGMYYVFLPSYADLQQVKILLNTVNPVSIDGNRLKNGMNCADYSMDTSYDLFYSAWGEQYHRKIIFLRSANVATMYIDTQSGVIDYIHEEKGNKESGTVAVYLPDGTREYSGKMESLQGRGNYTWQEYEKKPYSLKLSEEANLLGMGKAQKWVLLANAGDMTNLRNKLVYDLAEAVGLANSPEGQWADLYLNGEYAGLYFLSERNEIHSNRLNIGQSGSVLVSLEIKSKLDAQSIPSVTTDNQQTFRLHYPLESDEETQSEIKDMLQSVENAILSENGVDPVTGKSWTELIDMESWTKKYLIEEIVGNSDAGSISQFYYVDGNDQSGKLYAGPIWDYDRTMGNSVAWQLLCPRTFYANRIYVNSNYSTPWLASLYQKELFYNRIQEIYQNELLPLMETLFQKNIRKYSEQIAQASALNWIRWFSQEDALQEQMEALERYMQERIVFLNKVWLEERPYYRILADASTGANYANFIVFEGECLTDLPVFEDTETSLFLGWFDSDTAECFNPAQPITEDRSVYVKWQSRSVSENIAQAAKQKSEAEQWFSKVGEIGPLLILGVVFMILFAAELKNWPWTRYQK